MLNWVQDNLEPRSSQGRQKFGNVWFLATFWEETLRIHFSWRWEVPNCMVLRTHPVQNDSDKNYWLSTRDLGREVVIECPSLHTGKICVWSSWVYGEILLGFDYGWMSSKSSFHLLEAMFSHVMLTRICETKEDMQRVYILFIKLFRQQKTMFIVFPHDWLLVSWVCHVRIP